MTKISSVSRFPCTLYYGDDEILWKDHCPLLHQFFSHTAAITDPARLLRTPGVPNNPDILEGRAMLRRMALNVARMEPGKDAMRGKLKRASNSNFGF